MPGTISDAGDLIENNNNTFLKKEISEWSFQTCDGSQSVSKMYKKNTLYLK